MPHPNTQKIAQWAW